MKGEILAREQDMRERRAVPGPIQQFGKSLVARGEVAVGREVVVHRILFEDQKLSQDRSVEAGARREREPALPRAEPL